MATNDLIAAARTFVISHGGKKSLLDDMAAFAEQHAADLEARVAELEETVRRLRAELKYKVGGNV